MCNQSVLGKLPACLSFAPTKASIHLFSHFIYIHMVQSKLLDSGSMGRWATWRVQLGGLITIDNNNLLRGGYSKQHI